MIALIVLAVYGVARSRCVALGPSVDRLDVGLYRLHDFAHGSEGEPRTRWMYWVTLAMSLIGGVIWIWATLAESRAVPLPRRQKTLLSKSSEWIFVMPEPRVLILRAPAPIATWRRPTPSKLPELASSGCTSTGCWRIRALAVDFQILCLPGGFSYGDDIAAGRILGNQIRHHLAECLEAFRAADKLILGICNGFQILIKSGILLPIERAGTAQRPRSRGTRRANSKIAGCISRPAARRACFSPALSRCICLWPMPKANSCPAIERVLASLDAGGQLVLRYRDGAARRIAAAAGESAISEQPQRLGRRRGWRV